MLRAYDKATGAEVGAVLMPAPQSGSPMTYSIDGQAVHRRRSERRKLLGRIHRVQPPELSDCEATERRTLNLER